MLNSLSNHKSEHVASNDHSFDIYTSLHEAKKQNSHLEQEKEESSLDSFLLYQNLNADDFDNGSILCEPEYDSKSVDVRDNMSELAPKFDSEIDVTSDHQYQEDREMTVQPIKKSSKKRNKSNNLRVIGRPKREKSRDTFNLVQTKKNLQAYKQTGRGRPKASKFAPFTGSASSLKTSALSNS